MFRKNGRGRRRWPPRSMASSTSPAPGRARQACPVLHGITSQKCSGQQRAAAECAPPPASMLAGSLLRVRGWPEDRLRCLLSKGDRMPVQAQLVPMDCSSGEDIFGALAERRHEMLKGADPIARDRRNWCCAMACLSLLVAEIDAEGGPQVRIAQTAHAWFSPDWSTRSDLTYMSKGISPISSRNSVPCVSASSNLPGRPPFCAPVNAPSS